MYKIAQSVVEPLSVVVEPFKEEDRHVLHAFFERVIRHTFEKNELMHMEDLMNEEIEHKKKFLDEHVFLIAKNQEGIVGTIAYGPANADIVEGTKGALEGVLEVGSVFVEPALQGQGIGNILFDAIMKNLRENGQTRFCFDSGYPSAQKIWQQKFGAPTTVLQHFWGENAHHMIWEVAF